MNYIPGKHIQRAFYKRLLDFGGMYTVPKPTSSPPYFVSQNFVVLNNAKHVISS